MLALDISLAYLTLLALVVRSLEVPSGLMVVVEVVMGGPEQVLLLQGVELE